MTALASRPPRNPNLSGIAARTRAQALLFAAREKLQQVRDLAFDLGDITGLDPQDDAILEAVYRCEDPGEALRMLMDCKPGPDRPVTPRRPA